MASSSPIRSTHATENGDDNVDIIDQSSHGSNQSPVESDEDDIVFGPCTAVWYANGCALPGFKNDGVFSWELPITQSHISSVTDQVLHIPQESFDRLLKNKTSIIIRTRHNGDGVIWDLLTREGQDGRQSMYVKDGWIEFVKANNLKDGYKVQFQICNPPDVLIVEVIRHRTIVLSC